MKHTTLSLSLWLFGSLVGFEFVGFAVSGLPCMVQAYKYQVQLALFIILRRCLVL
jgi:hypothetical protein